MRTFKYIIGALAILFTAIHAVGLSGRLISSNIPSPAHAYAFGRFVGQVSGLFIGLAIAVFCFRHKKAPQNASRNKNIS